jgi:5-methylcytosine-specific restriction endonuclease McrA
MEEQYLFDREDVAIFHADDLDLRAKAIRYHLQPRLEQLLKQAMGLVWDMYGVDPMEYCTITRVPGFRTDRRKGKVTTNYTHCTVGLTGKRKPMWPKMRRAKDGKEPKVFWLNWSIELMEEGVFAVISTPSLCDLDHDSYAILMEPLIEHNSEVQAMLGYHRVRMHTSLDGEGQLETVAQRLQKELNAEEPSVIFLALHEEIPVSEFKGFEVAHQLASMYPIYDAWLRAAQGLPCRLGELVSRYNVYLESLPPEDSANAEQDNAQFRDHVAIDLERIATPDQITLPSRRYQVFLRDNWRCVSCGRDPVKHEAVLHVDHVLPRSKGGLDDLDNLQTLCERCNLGKGARDDTNIRQRLNGL